MKLRKFPSPDSENLTAEEKGMLSLATWQIRYYVWMLCMKARSLKTHYPAQFVDCVDSGVAELELGRFVWAVLELAPGRTLRSILVESPVEPPPELETLLSVFDMSLRLFEIMDQGRRPVGQSGLRYIFSDLQWGNVMVERDGGITLIDYDDEEVVACNAAEPPLLRTLFRALFLGRTPEETLQGCRWITEKDMCIRDTEAARDLLIDTLLMLMRIDVKSEWTDFSFHKSVDPGNGVVFIPKPILSYFYNSEIVYVRCITENATLGELRPSNATRALESLTSRLRPAYAEDWTLVSFLGKELFTAVSEAMTDPKWPPTFIEHLRRAREILQSARSGAT